MFTQIISVVTLADFTPQIAGIAAVAALLGWILKGALTKPQAVKVAANKEAPTKDRSKALEAALDKSKAAHKAAKSELESLQAGSVSTAKFEEAQATLETMKKSLEAEAKRVAVLETGLKKAQDTIKTLNARGNEVDKSQKDRGFALENELSKTRQQLALLEARPDDTVNLHAEIERLKESVATTTRYTGELRKREAAAQEALGKAQAQLSNSPALVLPIAAALTSAAPVGDSDRVAAAKAEVLRLLEQNKQSTAQLEIPAEAPLEIAFEEIVSGEIVSEEIVSEEIVSEEIVSEGIVSEEILSEEILSEEIVSDEIVSEEIVSEEIVSEEIVSEEIASEKIVSEEIVSEEIVSEEIESEEIVSGEKEPLEPVPS